ncbi:MAG: cytochrome c3 family protein [Rhodocyclaceae bacterium]|nr:cytochrome c3 family protein [Rhodocyclaceae bacterium]
MVELRQAIVVALGLCTGFGPTARAVAADPPSKAPNFGGVVNTRHNLTQSFLGVDAGWMDLSRNDYGEVCIYCHTPHGANREIAAPLWNRTQRATTYATYDQVGTGSLTQSVTQPGANSLTCLSCHDGQTAVDSVINMPGSGGYAAGQETGQSDAFLNAWPDGPGGSFFGGHGTLDNSPGALAQFGACQSCHSINGDQYDAATTPAFDIFFIETDLRNDHPVGLQFPGDSPDFNGGTVDFGKLRFFDSDGDGRPDPDEVRFYDTGEGFEVECASCHDPHGVPSNGPGSTFNPTFLRIANAGSSLCLSCHIK